MLSGVQTCRVVVWSAQYRVVYKHVGMLYGCCMECTVLSGVQTCRNAVGLLYRVYSTAVRVVYKHVGML